jgi:D-alanyl-D-alanine dipeptidase
MSMGKTCAVIFAAVWSAISAWSAPLSDVQQVLLVVPSDWNQVSTRMICFERTNSSGEWRKWGRTVPVVLGRNGLGWGTGLHPTNDLRGPIKREGDGKSPAGIFRLSGAFGYAEATSAKWIRLPYVQCTSALECVDDPQSRHYNTTLERSKVSKPDWQSFEHMKRSDELYELGIFIDHNVSPTAAGRGSCIFMHIWEARGIGTSGCTAMARERLEEILRWLEPSRHPVLVQLPNNEYFSRRQAWELPELYFENDILTQ